MTKSMRERQGSQSACQQACHVAEPGGTAPYATPRSLIPATHLFRAVLCTWLATGCDGCERRVTELGSRSLGEVRPGPWRIGVDAALTERTGNYYVKGSGSVFDCVGHHPAHWSWAARVRARRGDDPTDRVTRVVGADQGPTIASGSSPGEQGARRPYEALALESCAEANTVALRVRVRDRSGRTSSPGGSFPFRGHEDDWFLIALSDEEAQVQPESVSAATCVLALRQRGHARGEPAGAPTEPSGAAPSASPSHGQ